MTAIQKENSAKKELDRIRVEWRKKYRILNGKVIIWPDKPPEHINSRASKVFNWFWKKILLELNQHEIPAIIANIKQKINSEEDSKKIRIYRTMIGMAEDAYQLKNLIDIRDYDQDLKLEKKPIYNTETGIVYIDGKKYTADYSENETEIIIRDIEGIIVDKLSSENNGKDLIYDKKINHYKNWNYMKKT